VPELWTLGIIHAMKQQTIIGISLVLLIVGSVLAQQNITRPSDAEIRQKVPGSWTRGESKSVWNFAPDGSWFFSLPSSRTNSGVGGTWEIKDSVLIMTFTNSLVIGGKSFVRDPQPLPILRVDDHQMVYVYSGKTNTWSRQ
jgi:hypothetical protein